MGDWFDADGIDMDNMSIDLGDIIAMLNGDNQGNTEGFMHGEPPPSQIEKPFSSKAGAESTTGLENVRGKGHFQLNLEAASNSNREMGSGFLPEHGGHLDCITDSETHALLNSSQDSDNWLWSSHTNSNYPVIAPGGSSFFHSNFEQPQLQNNIGQFVAPRKSVKESDFIRDPVALPVNGCYFNSETWGNEHWELKSSFQNEYKELRPNADNICSPFNLQNGEPGSSYVFSQENFGYSDGMHSSISSSVLPDSEVEDGNMYPSLPISSRIDPHTFVHNAVHPVANTFDSINNTSDGSNSLTLTRDYTADAEFGIDQTGTANFPPFYSYNTEKLDRSESTVFASQNSHWINQSTLSTKEESPDSNSPDDYLDVSAPDELCSDYNHSDDMSLISESSTDSSSLPSSRTSMSDNVEGCVVNSSNHMVSGSETIWSSKPKPSVRGERGDHLHHGVLRGGSSAVQKNITRSSTSSEHDTDLCIIDDTSDLICLPTPPARPNLNTISKRSEVSDAHYSGVGGMGFRANDERSTIRRVLQDFSQRKSEANPPDGVLAVPLLKHQRIALSWMVQMETGVGSCSGGILADDQGLGKTVSTIALILTERSPSSRSLTVLKKEDEFKALNLDAGDDDDDDEVSVIKQPRNSIDMKTSKPVKKECPVTVVKGRPAAGTLVVCPTSVLRQWADELQTKVTTEANLSFLVYHGSNRTKDPGELAKFDVVLTTYAIVSMEVPKQPLVDKDDEEKGKRDISGMSSGVFNSKKRKDHPTSIVKNRKGRGTPDGAMLDSTARPLGRVAWFRVILDEAQSIKNHRTQVARACWGLRAKRRWCLSGTPIQNSVDDLYSYFRFLKYDPFAVYQSFCSKIKIPISKNPTKGFKKLQLVLRTIMLRRTKGTTLDGKPIIILPPKKISLKKVDFSMKERAFYSRLEAESREQYMEYEFAGTVKQNYVNILLMLLRLRQACDHPLLVKGCNSDSSQTSSMEMTMKLPKDKRVILLSRLEVSLAICTICNDPPEDAVVTICGHVFCNQCICQHLTTEENVCPSPDCKVHLSSASVFSRQTLKNSLSDELGGGNYSSSCSDVGMEVKHKKSEYNWSSYSSKIKAALEILQSLPRSQCHSSTNVDKYDGESSSSSVCQANDVQGRSSEDSSAIKCIGLDKCSNTNASGKAIIFSQWTGMLDLLETPLKASGIQYRRLDGTMSITARDKAVKDFKTLPEITVIIMSLKAASLGLNLVAANHVILLDLWWNPTTEDQAIDRAHRIGQTRPVSVSRLTVKDTVEDKILNLQQKKREMVASAFGENESGSRQMRLTEDDLRYLFNP